MPAIDPTVVGQLAAQLPREDYLMILRTFDEDFTRLSREFQDAATAADTAALRRAAHALAGAAAGVGAGPLEAVAREAMGPAPPDGAALARRIGEATAEARSALADLAAQAPPEE